jgi:hypothetical protein
MNPEELLSRVEEIEGLLRTGVAGHLDRVERLLMSIARAAAATEVANLAMKALSAVSVAKRTGTSADAAGVNEALSRLRAALLEAGKRS